MTDSDEEQQTTQDSESGRPPASPSIFSPVGNLTGYSVAADDDDDGMELDISPVRHAFSDRLASRNENDDVSWTDYHNDIAEPPRLRLESDLNAPLLNNAHPRGPAKLNGLNYLNIVTYFLNVFVSYGIGVWGLSGSLPTRVDVFLEYETLITPAKWAYFLWAPILVFEAIFAIAQLLPNYRARPIIQQGTGQHFSRVRGRKSLVEYWLFRFPFYLHCGWLIICCVVQFSILFRYLTGNVGVQLAADVVALGSMLPAATYFLTGQPSGPDFVIPLVIIWAYIGIALPLHHPSETLLSIYDHSDVVAVRDSAYFFACTVGLMLIPRVFIWMFQEFCTINVVELDDVSASLHQDSVVALATAVSMDG
eukprot:scaffold346_cov116-Cylindrotheca_fusiformis.AAC.28